MGDPLPCTVARLPRGALLLLATTAGCAAQGVAPAVEADAATTVDGAPATAVDAASPDGAPSAACLGAVPAERDAVWTITSGGADRRVLVHLPPGYDARTPMPVVLDLHALGSSAAVEAAYTGMNDKADQEGFVVLHPEGTAGSWNAGTCCGQAPLAGVDDVGFLTATIDRALEALCVDPTRVYATGMSNGGYMTHRLGCELADRLAAIAPVAGLEVAPACTPSRPLPVLGIHGTIDPVVPYAGALLSIAGWRDRNGCAETSTTTYDQLGTRCVRYDGCRAEVRFCSVGGGGHVWPGGLASPAAIDATDVVWDFFARHRRE